ncbi:sphingoid base hydroxylase 2 [Hibiscus trionum]|uniref:Sphingoid base hydroxylase 2 n=1 Tax=Hibiscus trionum TaxID=183268 RepID=A0A9W7M2P0_HIBTR|nr:sphingoid base hydroxylase 2 [Hibiscus trionum]
MGLEITKEMVVGSLIPIVVYWVYSGLYTVFGNFFNNYRLHPKEDEDNKNLVSKGTVIKGVLRQQFLTTIIMNLLHMVTRRNRQPASSLIVITRQIVVALLVSDTFQYFFHRCLHQNKFLYKHVHSKHHRLIVNYAYGAFYCHPIEGLLLGIIGGPLAVYVSGMSPLTSAVFTSFSVMKSVDDHSGFWIPWNPFHILFTNNVAYHDVHHQLYGGKYNFGQPFCPFWDKILGTYMDFRVEKREGGGFQLRPIKPNKD